MDQYFTPHKFRSELYTIDGRSREPVAHGARMPRILITQRALDIMQILVDMAKTEVGWFGVCERQGPDYVITDIELPKQRVCGTQTFMPAAGLSEMAFRLIKQGKKGEERLNKVTNFCGHSHVWMQTNPSTQDEAQAFQSSQGKDFYVRGIMNKHGRMEFTIFEPKLPNSKGGMGLRIVDPEWCLARKIPKGLRTYIEKIYDERVEEVNGMTATFVKDWRGQWNQPTVSRPPAKPKTQAVKPKPPTIRDHANDQEPVLVEHRNWIWRMAAFMFALLMLLVRTSGKVAWISGGFLVYGGFQSMRGERRFGEYWSEFWAYWFSGPGERELGAFEEIKSPPKKNAPDKKKAETQNGQTAATKTEYNIKDYVPMNPKESQKDKTSDDDEVAATIKEFETAKIDEGSEGDSEDAKATAEKSDEAESKGTGADDVADNGTESDDAESEDPVSDDSDDETVSKCDDEASENQEDEPTIVLDLSTVEELDSDDNVEATSDDSSISNEATETETVPAKQEQQGDVDNNKRQTFP